MLEEIIRRFKLGRRIICEQVHDYLHPDNPLYSEKIHETRVDGINPETDFWEGVGYLAGLTENIVKHPITM